MSSRRPDTAQPSRRAVSSPRVVPSRQLCAPLCRCAVVPVDGVARTTFPTPVHRKSHPLHPARRAFPHALRRALASRLCPRRTRRIGPGYPYTFEPSDN